MTDELLNNFVDMQEAAAIKTAIEMVNKPGGAVIVLETCKKAMNLVGDRFESGEYFLSELICAGDIFNQIMEFSIPLLQKDIPRKHGTMVLGTVASDVHNIGKDLFKVMAEASGIEVIDIGVDVSSEKYIEAIKQYEPDLLGLSCLITSGVDAMKHTINALREAGLKDEIKIIIGGGRVNDSVMKYTGADAWADDAARGVKLCNELLALKE